MKGSKQMEKKVTKKEKFATILAIVKNANVEDAYEGETEELVALLEGEMEALDKRAEKAKERAAKKKEEIDALGEQVVEVLGDATDFITIADIVAAIGDEDVTAAKVQARLGKLVKAEKVIKEDIAVGEEKRKRKGYKLA